MVNSVLFIVTFESMLIINYAGERHSPFFWHGEEEARIKQSS